MAKSTHSRYFSDSLDTTAQLLCVGARVLHDMTSSSEEPPVSFRDWVFVLRESPELQKTFTSDQHMIWLWESLRAAPDLRSFFGRLPSALNPWTSEDDIFDVFEPGERFVIGMTEAEVARLLKPPELIAEAERVCLKTQERLQMRPGKGHRLECCDCRSEVTIYVDKVLSLEREADIMRVEQDQVELGTGYVKVLVNSLNQAYTVASRRLEPQRRGHGGRTYGRLVHIGINKRTCLEDIRTCVESGSWPSLMVNENEE
ncbi:MAG: hypothetical protein JNL58_22020 [Planctomyces sp.]|nr:hypothetical protein [Planctomyces sp.]